MLLIMLQDYTTLYDQPCYKILHFSRGRSFLRKLDTLNPNLTSRTTHRVSFPRKWNFKRAEKRAFSSFS